MSIEKSRVDEIISNLVEDGFTDEVIEQVIENILTLGDTVHIMIDDIETPILYYLVERACGLNRKKRVKSKTRDSIQELIEFLLENGLSPYYKGGYPQELRELLTECENKTFIKSIGKKIGEIAGRQMLEESISSSRTPKFDLQKAIEQRFQSVDEEHDRLKLVSQRPVQSPPRSAGKIKFERRLPPLSPLPLPTTIREVDRQFIRDFESIPIDYNQLRRMDYEEFLEYLRKYQNLLTNTQYNENIYDSTNRQLLLETILKIVLSDVETYGEISNIKNIPNDQFVAKMYAVILLPILEKYQLTVEDYFEEDFYKNLGEFHQQFYETIKDYYEKYPEQFQTQSSLKIPRRK